MSEIDITTLFAHIANEATGKELTGLASSTVIAKLGLDSVAVMEIVATFEERLHIRLSDEELAGVRTIGDLGEAIARASAVAPKPSRPTELRS